MSGSCCGGDSSVKILSEAAVEDIQKLIGADLAYLVAVDVNGNKIPLTTDKVAAKVLDVSQGNPIKTQAITSIDSASFVSYTGSTCWVIQWGGGPAYLFCIP